MKTKKKAGKTKGKASRRAWWIVLAAVAVIALVIGGLALGLPALRRGRTVAASPHYTVTAGMYSYYYYDALYAQLQGDYRPVYEYYGIDETTDLTALEYESGKSWAAFFDESTRPRISAILCFAEAAIDEGITLTAEEEQEIGNAIKSETDKARAAGKKPSDYFAERYGKGVGEADIRAMKEIVALADHRAALLRETLTVEQSAIEDYAEAHPDDFLQADFLYYVLEAPDRTGMNEEEFAVAKAENLSRAAELASLTTAEAYTEWVKQRETALAAEKGEELTDGDWAEIKADFTYLQTDWSYAYEVDASMKTRKAGERFLTPDENTGSCGVVFVIDPPHRSADWKESVRGVLLSVAYQEAEGKLGASYADRVTLREDTLSLLLERTLPTG